MHAGTSATSGFKQCDIHVAVIRGGLPCGNSTAGVASESYFLRAFRHFAHRRLWAALIFLRASSPIL